MAGVDANSDGDGDASIGGRNRQLKEGRSRRLKQLFSY